MNDVDYDIQEKLMNIMKERQIQLTELKTYFDKQNTKHYKDIIKLNLNKFEDIISKSELNKKCESLLSIAISISKILELNHSVKSILLSLKIMEEHKKHVTSTINKSFVYKIFEDSSLIALNKNPWLKKRNFSYAMTDFYKALFEESDNFFNDFNNYLNFQTDKKQKPSDSKIKANVFADQVTKILAGSTVNNYILYKPCYIVGVNIFLLLLLSLLYLLLLLLIYCLIRILI